jgi:Tfp pilus assembly protein PilF
MAEARAEGLRLEDPLAIDPDILAGVEKAVGRIGSPAERMHGLVMYLTERGYMNFQYTPGRSLTARQAYRERRGDCMAYAVLFVALSRHLGLATYFVHVTDVRNYYEHGGWFFVSSHVAVGHDRGPTATVVDFTREITDWKLALYESIDDGEALALFHNNAAVDAMTAGRTAEAERLLRFLLAREPGVAELYNNLGVLLNRTGRAAEAMAVLDRGLERFPRYEPLYTNAIRAARAAGRPELAAGYERRGAAVHSADPYFLFARALTLYEQDRYVQAAAAFARASEAKPDSPVILAWLARSYLSAGRRREGLEALERTRKLSPEGKIVQELERLFPELGGARRK